MEMDSLNSLLGYLYLRFHGCPDLLWSSKNGIGFSGLYESFTGD